MLKIVYKIANRLRRIYWFIFRPKTTGVKCLIECRGEYLLIQTTYSGNYWTLPGGGVKYQENLVQAIMREVKEEVGISLGKVQLLGQYESSVEYKKDTVNLFYANIHTKELLKRDAEILKTQWFSKNTLPENQSRALREISKIVK